MVSWERAFRAALATVAWSIIWALVGGGIIIVGISGSYRIGPYGIPQSEWGTALLAIIIGYAIMALGLLASLYKMQSEITADEVERRLLRMRGRIFCHKCGAENLTGAKFCAKCGMSLASQSVEE